ncbi:pentatricopeptide repeat-containing protein At1g32415, mitochondrial-like [Phoenix dactylifera]|uniref:Pentatricopeptide repeat-containing protein At1g32415, mitochondrial-like n=1 Tax=Phoenix dactylifera TaxID=42345 RepID=A0A8B7CA95_PHODC|nr:pentatricopeptide repeat-containing protein At1g32415, mitochondrial-like [Phoenix dactylifera]
MSSRSLGARRLANLFTFASKPNATPKLTVCRTKMIMEYGRRGEVDKAVQVFEKMPQRNQISWNAMLSVLVDSGRVGSALQLFDEMPHRNSTSYTSMISGLSRSGLVLEARHLFDSIPSRDQNVFSWTAVISCYAQNNEPVEALKLFSGLYGALFKLKILPNSHTFSALLKCCGCIRSLAAARQIQSLIAKLLDEEGEGCVFVHNCLIDVNAKLGSLVEAEEIFNRMRWKDLGSWNAMMDAYTHHLLIDKALEIFHSMEEKDTLSWNIAMSGLLESRRGEEALRLSLLLRSGGSMKPNSSTYSIILSACAALTMLEFGRQIHAITVKIGLYWSNIFVCNSLITMYASCGLSEELKRVFDEMPKKDEVSWNSVIQGLGQNGYSGKALKIAEKALDSKNFNHNTFVAILTGCSHGGLVKEGLDYFHSMRKKYGIDPSLDHYICVVDMLGRAGWLKEAHSLLGSMPLAANSVAWHALLNACMIHGDADMGRIAAKELQILEPCNARSYLGLANIYGRTDKIEESRRLFDLIRKKELRKEPGCSWVVQT